MGCVFVNREVSEVIGGTLLLTTACPVECEHCLWSCTTTKEKEKWMSEKTIRRVADEFSKNNMSIRISGGEPFYDKERLKNCIEMIQSNSKSKMSSIMTSGFWATDEKKTIENLKILKKGNIHTIQVSTDRYHIRKVPLSNIINILERSKQLSIRVELVISLDSKSYEIINSLSEIIKKHKPHLIIHGLGFFGRAEKLDRRLNDDFKKIHNLFLYKIGKNDSKNLIDEKFDNYFIKPKFYNDFLFPTVFPNGNTYGCCDAKKLTYIGNINREDLSSMLEKFQKSLAGQILFNFSNCNHLLNFLPPNNEGKCDFCHFQPFIENGNKKGLYGREAIGKDYIILNGNSDLDEVYKKKLETKKGVLLSLRFPLNIEQKKINSLISFLEKLKTNNIHFTISRPITKCLLGKEHKKIIEKFNIPKNCFECHELFSVEDEYVRLCPTIYNKKGPKFLDMKNRNDIFDEFSKFHKKLKPMEKCDDCIYFMRNQCNGMCFKIDPGLTNSTYRNTF